MLNGLDLFSGIGGISLALRPWLRTVCYVENDPYCQQVIAERIADGRLDDAPIWDDVRTFDPGPWRGLVDIAAGGFPCQDISTAGRGAGLAGERSGLFSEIVRIAGDLRPRFIYLENVAAIVAAGRGGWDVVGALAALGYDARWGVLAAADVGAPHLRERWWCLAADNAGEQMGIAGQSRERGSMEALAHSNAAGLERGVSGTGGEAAVASAERCSAVANPIQCGGDGRPDRIGRRKWEQGETLFNGRCGGREENGLWLAEPDVGRVANGIPARVDRLRGLGNAVVPACAREAFKRLMMGD